MKKTMTLFVLLCTQAAFAASEFDALESLADGKIHSGRATNASGACEVRLSLLANRDVMAQLNQSNGHKYSMSVPAGSHVEKAGSLLSYVSATGATLEVASIGNNLVHLKIEGRDGSGITCGGLYQSSKH